jgi:hypothetical protein
LFDGGFIDDGTCYVFDDTIWIFCENDIFSLEELFICSGNEEEGFRSGGRETLGNGSSNSSSGTYRQFYR